LKCLKTNAKSKLNGLGKGEGEEILERGETPLLPTLPLPLLREGVRGIGC